MGCNNSKTKDSKAAAKEHKHASSKKEEQKAKPDTSKANDHAVSPAAPPAATTAAAAATPEESIPKKDSSESEKLDESTSTQEMPRTTAKTTRQHEAEAAPVVAAEGFEPLLKKDDAEPRKEVEEAPKTEEVKAAEDYDGAAATKKTAPAGTPKEEVKAKSAAAAAVVVPEAATAEKKSAKAQQQQPSPATSASRTDRQRIMKPIPDRFLQPKNEGANVMDAQKNKEEEENAEEAAGQHSAVPESHRDVDVDDVESMNTPESDVASEVLFSHTSDRDEDGAAAAGVAGGDRAGEPQEPDAAVYCSEWGNDTANRVSAEEVDVAEPPAATQASASASYSVAPLTHVDTSTGLSEAPQAQQQLKQAPASTSKQQTSDQTQQLHPAVYKKMPVAPASESVSTVKVARLSPTTTATRRQRSPSYRCLSDGRTPSVGRHPSHVRTADMKSSSEAASRSHSANASVKREAEPVPAVAVPSTQERSVPAPAAAAKKPAAKTSTVVARPSARLAVHTRPSTSTSPATAASPAPAAAGVLIRKKAPVMPARASESTRKPRTTTPTTVKRQTVGITPTAASSPQPNKTPRSGDATITKNATPRAAGKSKAAEHRSGAHPTGATCGRTYADAVKGEPKPKTYAEAVKEGPPAAGGVAVVAERPHVSPASPKPAPVQPHAQPARQQEGGKVAAHDGVHEAPRTYAEAVMMNTAPAPADVSAADDNDEADSDAEKEVDLPAAQRHSVEEANGDAAVPETASAKTADAVEASPAVMGEGGAVAVADVDVEGKRTEDQVAKKPEPEWHVVPSAEPVERPSLVSQAKTVMNMRNLTAI
jgi:hypothetical protein